MSINIKDLPDSIDLDREAMSAISGGARVRGRQAFSASTLFRRTRVIDFPAGFGGESAVGNRSAGNSARKK